MLLVVWMVKMRWVLHSKTPFSVPLFAFKVLAFLLTVTLALLPDFLFIYNSDDDPIRAIIVLNVCP